MTRRTGGIAVAGRLGWGVADQAVSSLSNFLLGIIVARSLGAEGFGAFSLAFITYAFILSASRGLSTDPLLVRYSDATREVWARAVSSSSATAAAFGLVGGVVCIAVGLVLPASVGDAFVALGVTVWGLLLQDSWRFAFFAAGRPRAALLNDLVWGLLLVVALVVLHLVDRMTVVTSILALGATAIVAAGVGYLQCRVRPAFGSIRAWLVEHKALGPRYLIENVAIGGARQARFFLLGSFAGLVAVGETRGAEILMGPFLVLLMGVSQVAVPEAALVLARSPRRLLRFCFVLGSVAATTAATWGLLVHLLLPLGLGQLLLGSLWIPAAALLPPVILAFSMGGFEIGAAAGVRALGAARRSLRAQLINASLYVALGGGGAVLDGARGSCWGVAVATTLGALVWWVQLRRGLHDHLTDTDDTGHQVHLTDRIPS